AYRAIDAVAHAARTLRPGYRHAQCVVALRAEVAAVPIGVMAQVLVIERGVEVDARRQPAVGLLDPVEIGAHVELAPAVGLDVVAPHGVPGRCTVYTRLAEVLRDRYARTRCRHPAPLQVFIFIAPAGERQHTVRNGP